MNNTITTYGTAAFNPTGKVHLILERKHDDGHIERRVACNCQHNSWQFYGDEWFEHEYQAADKVLKTLFYGCYKCKKLITQKATCFPDKNTKK